MKIEENKVVRSEVYGRTAYVVVIAWDTGTDIFNQMMACPPVPWNELE